MGVDAPGARTQGREDDVQVDPRFAACLAADRMRIDPDKPGLFELLSGEGEPAMQAVAWLFVFAIVPLLIAGTMVTFGIAV